METQTGIKSFCNETTFLAEDHQLKPVRSQINTQIEAHEVLLMSFSRSFLDVLKGVSDKYVMQCRLLAKVFAALKSDKSGKK